MRENNYYHVDKKSRLQVEQQEDNEHQDPREQDLQMQAWTRQQRQFLQSMSMSQRPPLPQQQQDPREQDPQMQAWTRQQRQFLQSMSMSQRPPLPQQQQDPREQDPQMQAWTRQQKQFLQSMSMSQRPPLPQQQQDPREQDPQMQAWTRQQRQFLQSMSMSQRPPLPQQQQDPREQDPQMQAWTRQQKQFLQSMSMSQRPPLPQQQQDPREQDPQMQAWTRQQKQFLQSMSMSQRPPLPQQHQMRRRLHQQGGAQQIPPNVRPYEASVCSQKLMMFLYHITQRPADNCITFWRRFVAEYFSPHAKQRLCLSQYKRAGHMLGLLPQDTWQCRLCGTQSGKGVEATYDVLARLFEVKFASGVIKELLSLNEAHEYRFSNGLMVLEYKKAVQTTVYEQCRVVREGHLRITFSQDLKILSWEFCARRHEEFLVRRLIAPQVNQLLQVALKCQSTMSETGPEGVSKQDLQTNTNMVLEAGRQLAKSTGLQSLNDFGYPKKYVRALQTYEVVKSMRDLMDFTYEHRIGPIEGWKRLSEQAALMRHQREKMQEKQLENCGVSNRSAQAQMALNPGNNNFNNHQQIVGYGAVNGSAPQAAAALTDDQSLLMWLKAMNNTYSNTGFTSQSPSPYLSQQCQNLATGGFPSSPQMQQQQGFMYGTPNTLQQTHSHHLQPPHSQGNYQQVLDQMFQEVYGNPSVQRQQAFLGRSGSNSNAQRSPTGFTFNISGGGRVPSRNNNNPHLSEDATEVVPDDFSQDNFSNDSDV